MKSTTSDKISTRSSLSGASSDKSVKPSNGNSYVGQRGKANSTCWSISAIIQRLWHFGKGGTVHR